MMPANQLPQHILAEWHPELNPGLDVSTITAGSHLKVWWLGKDCGHVWEANVQSRALKNQGCSVCAGKTVLKGFNDLATKFPLLASEWHPTKNGSLHPTQVTSGSSKNVWWLGQDCWHEWEAVIGNRASKGHRCSFCFGKKVLSGVNDLATLYPKIAAEWHPTKNGDLLPTQVRPNSRKKIWWLGTDCKHDWEALLGNRVTSGHGCSVCAGQQISIGSNDLVTTHPEIASEWHPTLNNISVSSVTHGSGKKVWWLGKDCGHEWEAVISARTGQAQSCPYCSGQKVLIGFNDFPTRFPELASEWHPTKNDAARPTEFSYASNHKAWWACSEGHEWEMLISSRTAKHSQACPFCAGKRVLLGYNDLATTHPLIAAQWHPTNNEGLLPTHVSSGSKTKVWWANRDCGHEWEMYVYSRTGTKPQGCPFCGSGTILPGFNDLTTVYPLIAAEWHPTLNHDLLPTEVFGVSGKKVWWLGQTCKHEWEAFVKNRVNGSGCPICAGQQVLIGFNDLLSQKPVIAAQWHSTKNVPLLPEQFTIGSDKKIWWSCDKNHEWLATIYSRGTGNSGCPECYASTFVSQAEHSLAEFVRQLGLEVVQSDRKTLKGKELDILVPEKSVAIEYNGVFWHSEIAGKDKDYHRDKWLAAKDAGIQLVQIWEDEWNRNPEQIKRMIAHKLGVTNERKVFARKTTVSAVIKKTAEKFLEENHVQGYAAGSYYYGLFDKDKPTNLVALLVLKKEQGNGLNIIRYATSANVIGGFTKLLKYAERMLSPEFFITFSDNCVSDGGLYKNNGFVADKELKPDYRYVVGGERKHKFGYRLKRFMDDPALIWVDGLKERELADLNGIPRIWDAGKIRWVKKCS